MPELRTQDHDVSVESHVPEDWIPEGAAVYVCARLDLEGSRQWESLIPEFGIAGMGESPELALSNALELLDDYLSLCARDGLSFDDARRPIGFRHAFAVAMELLALGLASVKRSGRSKAHDRERYRVPLRPRSAH